jgi:hypothetical protein
MYIDYQLWISWKLKKQHYIMGDCAHQLKHLSYIYQKYSAHSSFSKKLYFFCPLVDASYLVS